jgi:hypothetical protein
MSRRRHRRALQHDVPAVMDRLPAAATRLRTAALSWTAAPACSDISWLMAATGLGCAGLGGPGRICANCYTLPSIAPREAERAPRRVVLGAWRRLALQRLDEKRDQEMPAWHFLVLAPLENR